MGTASIDPAKGQAGDAERAARIIDNESLRREVLRRLCWTYADDVYAAMHDREERMAAIKDGTYGKKYTAETLG